MCRRGELPARSHRDRCSGKPLRTISRCGHQNDQTPPSPRVGEGSWGDEGQTRTEMAMRTARDTLATASEPRHPQQRLPEILVECAVGCFRRDPHIPATVGVLQRGGQRRDDLPAQAGRG